MLPDQPGYAPMVLHGGVGLGSSAVKTGYKRVVQLVQFEIYVCYTKYMISCSTRCIFWQFSQILECVIHKTEHFMYHTQLFEQLSTGPLHLLCASVHILQLIISETSNIDYICN